jgi:RNA-binding protein
MLKGRAHALEPVVQVGQAGLTDAVIAEADRALTAHELIKVKIGTLDRDDRSRIVEQLCASTDAALVQTVGKIAVLWRPRDENG